MLDLCKLFFGPRRRRLEAPEIQIVTQSPAEIAAPPIRASLVAGSMPRSLHPTMQGFPICRATSAA